MINVEWHNNETCDNCSKENQAHCAEIDFNFAPDDPDPSPDRLFSAMLCSTCVEDLKKRLS